MEEARSYSLVNHPSRDKGEDGFGRKDGKKEVELKLKRV